MEKLYINKETMKERNFREMELRERILTWSEGYQVPVGIPEEQSLERLMGKIHQTPRGRKVNMSFRLWAAALLPVVLLITGGILAFSPSKVKTSYAEQKSLILPDQSEITLNAGSKLTYFERSFDKNRSIRLDGEAFLKVKKGTGFTIHTPNGIIRILGTELNILSRDEVFRVTCLSGKVEVSSHGQNQIIAPGEEAELNNNQLVRENQAATGSSISWKNGTFNFEDTPLLYIFDEIERQFDVRIETQGLENRIFTGSFSNKNLKETLDIVCIPMELKYEVIKGKKVVITSETDQ